LIAAFGYVQRDEGCTLHQAQLIDQSLHRDIPEEEYEEAKLLDPYSNWYEVPSADIDACEAALSHITPEGWRFYIPAYMKRAIELVDKPIWETDLTSSVIFHLTLPSNDPLMRHYVLERFKILNEEQVQAVAMALTFFANHLSSTTDWREDATTALNSYWGLERAARPTVQMKLD
jgi:hypothetical protein